MNISFSPKQQIIHLMLKLLLTTNKLKDRMLLTKGIYLHPLKEIQGKIIY
ncbi:hypothetical protein P9865_07825 [Clostridium sporogenes]|nr:hypothetical protein [Clostridium sporogenes]